MIDEITITSLSGRGSVTMATRDYRGYWLGEVDWGTVEGQHNTYGYYNQVGENIVSTTLNTRPIAITGWVIEYEDSMQERCDFLNTFISPVDDYELSYGDRKIQFRPDISIKYSRPYVENNQLLRKFLIQGTAPYPLFTSVENTVSEFESIQNAFRFPTNLGMASPLIFGIVAKAYQKEIVNSGGYETGLIATVTFSGEVTNPRVRNQTTGGFIGVSYTFKAADTLEICTMPGNKYMKLIDFSGAETNLLKKRTYGTTWIQLQPGSNIIALDCDNADELAEMSLEIQFTPLFMEVE